MARQVDFKRYGQELGDILALIELINRYLSVGRRGRAPKSDKAQNDRSLVKVLKNDYSLAESDVNAILKVVAGKKSGKSQAALKPVNETDRASLKKEIDSLVSKIGITIRSNDLKEDDYLRKVKGNLSVRKGKIMSIVHPTREKRVKK